MNLPETTPVYVGAPIERVEDLRLLRGEGRYVDDQHVEGMLHAVIVRSTVAHGVLRSIDTSAARAMPGVRAIYTAQDVADGGAVPVVLLRVGSFPQIEPYGQPVIATGKVRYVGEPLAIVVADSAGLAEDAADAVVPEIDPLPAVVDRESVEGGTSLLFEETSSNIAVTYTAIKGDAPSKKPAYCRRERFRIQRHSAVFMEPRGLLADWHGAATHLKVTGSAKVPYANRRELMRCMDLPEECIEMLGGDFGGGFGVRGDFYPEDFLVPFASRKLGRPVKWIEDRRENLLAANHARDVECELEVACESDGRIVSLTGKAWVNVGAYYRMSGAVQPRNVAHFIAGPYRVPHVHMEASVMVTNKTPNGAYRGPGRFEADFFRERMFDIAARDLGIDPVEFRRRNLVTREEMPYRLPTLTPVEANDEFDSGDYSETLERCLSEIGWKEKAHLQGARQPDGRYHGLGVGCFVEGGGAGPRETARIVAEADGCIAVHVGSANIGQGMETAFSQIAADALGVDLERIRLLHGGTGVLKEGFGSFHSRSIVMGGSAILDAANKFKRAVTVAASKILGCAEESVHVSHGLVAGYEGRALDLTELVTRTAGGVVAEGVFNNHHHTYAYGAAAAHVAVDSKTGRVELLEYVTVEDVGRIINPLTLVGQGIGAVVQGLGGVFLERMVYDESGQFLCGSLADYMMPTATDFPNIRAIVTGNHPSPHNPLGAKGGGEGGVIPVGGVIANAVEAALAPLGVQVRALPLTPPNVWGMVRKAAFTRNGESND